MWLALLFWFLVVLFAVLWYSGLFTPITVTVDRLSAHGDLQIYYKYGKGAYWTCGQLFKELGALVPKDAWLCGIYYDDPQSVPSNECRWAVGVVSKAKGCNMLTENYILQLNNWGYKSIDIPEIRRGVIAWHPYTTFISIYIAPMRVYKAITEFSKKERIAGYPALEFYHDQQIEYCMPLEHQAACYVPEAGPPPEK